MKILPPFDALVAFHAVAETASMTEAGEQIGITQSAVSHRIRRLEEFVGVTLFERKTTGLVLTLAGESLFKGVGDILDASRGLRAKCLQAAAPNMLRVGVGSALADNWLVRRLPAFRAANPATQIELSVVENERPDKVDDLDVRILWVSVSEARTSSTQRPLFREHVFPACSPMLLKGRDLPLKPRALEGLPLLQKRSPPGYIAGAEWSWQTWFDRLGLRSTPKEALRFSSIGPLVSAAKEGAGVALLRTMVAKDALADGRLVRVLPPEDDMLSIKVHVVRWPGRLVGDPRVRIFADWVCEEARKVDDEMNEEPVLA